MYTSLYFYRVPDDHAVEFLEIQKVSAQIYKKYGAIDDWTFSPENLNSKYGCTSFLKELSTGPNEKLFFSLSIFKDEQDHYKIMSAVDQDPEIEALYARISKILDLSKVIRGEFNRVV